MDSKIIYLYLKTHNKTGLKYLGKTSSDPFKYKGSGKYWKRHLYKHGDDVTTEILFQSTCKNEIKEKGLYYSNLWSIVESDNFANLKEEAGDGGAQLWPKESREKLSKSLKSLNKKYPDRFKNRKPHTKIQKKRMSASQKKHIKENKEEHINTMKKYLYTDDANMNRRKKMSKYKWWNNGNVNTRSEISPGEDFVLGRLRK
jgi:hypothetical protein